MNAAERARRVIARELGVLVDRVVDDARLAALGADQIDVLNIVIEIEDAFGVVITDEELGPDMTVREVVALACRSDPPAASPEPHSGCITQSCAVEADAGRTERTADA